MIRCALRPAFFLTVFGVNAKAKLDKKAKRFKKNKKKN
jgi:hypothetical protein